MELLLVRFDGARYGIWRNQILSLQEARTLHRLPFAGSSIAVLASVGERAETVADLAACLGHSPASRQAGARILRMTEAGPVSGFVVGCEPASIPVPDGAVIPIPDQLRTSVVDTCVLHDSQPVPIINISALFQRALAGNGAPRVAPRSAGGRRTQDAPKPDQVRRALVGGCLFAIPGVEGGGEPLPRALISPIPLAQRSVAGIASVRGCLLAIIDVAGRLGLRKTEGEPTLLVARVGETRYGLLTGEDRGAWTGEECAVRDLPSMLRTRWMRQAALDRQAIAPLLDLEALVSGADHDAGEERPRPLHAPDSRFPVLFNREQVEVLEFSLPGTRQAVPKCEVESILPWRPFHEIPFAPPIAAGVSEQGGELLPVLDLARLYGKRSAGGARWSMILLANGDFRALVMCETVFGERALQPDIQRPLPFVLPHPMMYGCYIDGNAVRLILNVEQLAIHFEPSLMKRFEPSLMKHFEPAGIAEEHLPGVAAGSSETSLSPMPAEAAKAAHRPPTIETAETPSLSPREHTLEPIRPTESTETSRGSALAQEAETPEPSSVVEARPDPREAVSDRPPREIDQDAREQRAATPASLPDAAPRPHGRRRKLPLTAALVGALLLVGLAVGLAVRTVAARTAANPPASVDAVPSITATAPAGQPLQQPEAVETKNYIVQEGDTLWGIAVRFTGNPFNYTRIAGENGITDPDMIFPGQSIRLSRPSGGKD